MKFLDKLDRKYGRHAIYNLMRYIIIIYIAGYVMNMYMPALYTEWLSLNVEQILRGQVWRLVTFLLITPQENLIFFLIEILLYYSIGQELERYWGAFKFNVYVFSGILFQIVAAFVVYGCYYLTFGVKINTDGVGSFYYVLRSMFLAYIALIPDAQFLIWFVIPIRAKWLGILEGAFMAFEAVSYLVKGGILEGGPLALAIVISAANFLIFFFATRDYRKHSPSEMKRRNDFRRKMDEAKWEGADVIQFRGRTVVTKHKCAICGRSELDDDNLEFRFCSKCEGNYEYCSEHLFTHTHVKKEEPKNPDEQ